MSFRREYRFEMALTLAEVGRLAPVLAPDHPTTFDGDGARGAFGPEAVPWSIGLSAPRERIIAGLRFPIADVTVRLDTDDEGIAARFLDRFHLVFRKGGG